MKFSNIIALVSIVVCFGCKNNDTEKRETLPQEFNKDMTFENEVEAEKVESIDSLLRSYVENQKVNAVTAFVAHKGNVLYNKAFGFKNIEDSTEATTDDYYVLFSQTKAIVTVAFMTLVDQGKVSVDDPVSKYFSEISDQVVTKVNEDGTYETRPVETPMTFAHLMSHSSGLGAGLVSEIRKAENKNDNGLVRFEEEAENKVPHGQRSFGTGNESKYLKDEMLKLAEYPLGFDPGSDWNYHVSTNMLAYMVEVISGKPLQEYVKETILDPLEMDDTDWYYEPEALERFVTPYKPTENGLEAGSMMFAKSTTSENRTYAEGAIGLNGPIEDYAKFCQMLLNEGTFNDQQILKPETIEMMTDVNQLPDESSAEEGFQFGLGFQLHNENLKHIPAVSNSAFSWGGMFGTEYIIDPEKDLIVLFYINMVERENLYHPFLTKAYKLVE